MRPSRFVHRNKSNQSKDTNIRHSRFVPVFLHQLVVGRSRPSVSAINHTSVSDSSGPPAPNEQATDTAQSRRFSALTDSLSHFALFSPRSLSFPHASFRSSLVPLRRAYFVGGFCFCFFWLHSSNYNSLSWSLVRPGSAPRWDWRPQPGRGNIHITREMGEKGGGRRVLTLTNRSLPPVSPFPLHTQTPHMATRNIKQGTTIEGHSSSTPPTGPPGKPADGGGEQANAQECVLVAQYSRQRLSSSMESWMSPVPMISRFLSVEYSICCSGEEGCGSVNQSVGQSIKDAAGPRQRERRHPHPQTQHQHPRTSGSGRHRLARTSSLAWPSVPSSGSRRRSVTPSLRFSGWMRSVLVLVLLWCVNGWISIRSTHARRRDHRGIPRNTPTHTQSITNAPEPQAGVAAPGARVDPRAELEARGDVVLVAQRHEPRFGELQLPGVRGMGIDDVLVVVGRERGMDDGCRYVCTHRPLTVRRPPMMRSSHELLNCHTPICLLGGC